MIIEIRGAGFLNKGAELMLLAIIERLRRRYPDALLSVIPSDPTGARPYTRLVDLRLYPKVSLVRRGVEFGDAVTLIPERLRRRYGLLLDREVDVVLDASGFAYSDLWGSAAAQELARAARRWRRRGTRVILLPQAFGPFEDPAIRKALTRAIDDVDLVMPRDGVSQRYLTDLVGERDSIQRFPDFTNLIEGRTTGQFDGEVPRVAVVPNARMLDKTDASTGERYVPFMVSCVRVLKARDARPFLLVHEGADDERLARRISDECGDIPIVCEQNPLVIKGILGACRAVVASRFHALVSALSQGVPALATGWSHKYAELFKDYGFPEGVMSMDEVPDQIEALLACVTDEESRRQIASTLERESARLKGLSESMWSLVERVIDEGRR